MAFPGRGSASASDAGDLRTKVQRYLYSSSADERDDLLRALPTSVADPIALVRSALLRRWNRPRAGTYLDEHFSHPFLRPTYPDDLLNVYVPETYAPEIPHPLVIFLHGGDKDTDRTYAAKHLAPNAPLLRLFEEGKVVGIVPTNLLLPTPTRWSSSESDRYLTAVIEEATFRFNIDHDRIILVGQSMGAYGAYHAVQTLGDRFAAVAAFAGAWRIGFWEGVRGVWFEIVHAANDQVAGSRPKFTDVFHARLVHALLSGYHIHHVYSEHDGGHSFGSPEGLAVASGRFRKMLTRRRIASPRYVATASGKGSFQLIDTPHFFWVTIDAVGDGFLEYDAVESTHSDFNETDFRCARRRIDGRGALRAEICGENLVSVTTENVRAFTLWLSPELLDCTKPVCLQVNGHPLQPRLLQPTLTDVLASWTRRRDPGLLYSAKWSVTLTEEQMQSNVHPCRASAWTTASLYSELPDGRWKGRPG